MVEVAEVAEAEAMRTVMVARVAMAEGQEVPEVPKVWKAVAIPQMLVVLPLYLEKMDYQVPVGSMESMGPMGSQEVSLMVFGYQDLLRQMARMEQEEPAVVAVAVAPGKEAYSARMAMDQVAVAVVVVARQAPVVKVEAVVGPVLAYTYI